MAASFSARHVEMMALAPRGQLVAAHEAVSFSVGAEAEGSCGGVAVRLGCTVFALDRGRAHVVLSTGTASRRS
jgi:hypothetical protein